MSQEPQPAITKFTASDGMRQPRESQSFLVLLGSLIRKTDLDCSHFVQYLYQSAGLDYGYAPSRILYAGMDGFRRVSRPKTGDLIVWPGHVGVVVDPVEATFLSALRSGVKTSSYQSSYWKRRGRPRFFHYIGSAGQESHLQDTRYPATHTITSTE